MSLLAQDERVTRRVGAVVLALLVAAIGFAVFVAHRIEWGSHVRIRVYFHHTGGLREGAPFVVAGQPVGDVETIARSAHGAETPLGGDEGVEVSVAVERDAAERIMRGGDIFVASRGAFGERYLEIGPSPEPAPSLAEGSDRDNRFLGRDPPSLDRVLQNTWANLTTAREFAVAIGPEVDALRLRLRELGATIDGLVPRIGDVASLAVEVQGLLAEARQLRDTALGGDAGIDRLGDVVTTARATLARARGVLDVLGARARALGDGVDALRARTRVRGPTAIRTVELAIDRMRRAIDQLDPLLAKVEEVRGRIARGEGSLGRLSSDPEFPEDAKELGKIMKRQPWKIISRPKD